MPAAATTIAAIVERFTVLARSPPVPTMSTVSVPITSVGTIRAYVSIVSANSRTSAGVGRFIFIDTPKAAIWAGVAAPVMIWSIAQCACPGSSSRLAVNRSRTCDHDDFGWSAPGCDAG
ncbi:hypothetical protein MSAR_35920 [Mycolicibacterium sarraceniae]|uniref:Uncharacterized protein n=1 Tax=Mycolicibacterium sarraceniae TaxID=1534348 RepID=A0A7I7SXB6_9MYCO|nr:hypothetical protein MSAR_35920 [Mycolicibacterium sarraceniae]